jgi:hypothetical protein
MQNEESKMWGKEDLQHCGFIDPNQVNEVMVNDNPKDTEDNLLWFLVKQEYKNKILFPYNFR